MPYGPDVLVPFAFFACIAIVVVGTPFVRALARRWDRESIAPRVPSEVMARLERMEQAIDAMAVEMERVSEGQRFMTKLLAERPRELSRLARPNEESA